MFGFDGAYAPFESGWYLTGSTKLGKNNLELLPKAFLKYYCSGTSLASKLLWIVSSSMCRYANGVHDYVRDPDKQDRELVIWLHFHTLKLYD
jgi:hypothetical protein